jgi:hypothetical protein
MADHLAGRQPLSDIREVPRGPPSCLFFVVAKVGPSPDGHHHLLAVVERQGGVLESCLHAVRILSYPANRSVIRSEPSLAADFYRNAVNAPPRRRDSSESSALHHTDNGDTDEFPFVSTRLLPAAGL